VPVAFFIKLLMFFLIFHAVNSNGGQFAVSEASRSLWRRTPVLLSGRSTSISSTTPPSCGIRTSPSGWQPLKTVKASFCNAASRKSFFWFSKLFKMTSVNSFVNIHGAPKFFICFAHNLATINSMGFENKQVWR